MEIKERLIQILLALSFAAISLSGCESPQYTYTLYRNSVLDENMRVHIATFDASDGHDYNMTNCQLAAEVFKNQNGVKTKYWCEKGRFQK